MKKMKSALDKKESLIYDHLKDVTVISKDEDEIQCHGLILSVRSKVFETILEPTKKSENTINIKDFDTSTIRKMLRYIYTDTVDEDEIDIDLLAIADMYQIDGLKIACEKNICKDLDVNNVLDAWIGANKFNCNMLLNSCKDFLFDYWLDVQMTKSFSRLMKENGDDMKTLAVMIANMYANSKAIPRNNSLK